MPTTTSRRTGRSTPGSRAEARRRGRRLAEADGDAVEGEAEESSTRPGGTGTRPSLLQRFFPEAPPLPGKTEPLAGFHYDGPPRLRPLAAARFVLGANPLAWLLAGVLWAAARPLILLAPNSFGDFFISLIQFGALIGAGYVGWRRPWLYGLAAALVGLILLIVLSVAVGAANGTATGELLAAAGLTALSYGPLQALTGAVAGWFGGYWRRRLVVTRAEQARARQLRGRRAR